MNKDVMRRAMTRKNLLWGGGLLFLILLGFWWFRGGKPPKAGSMSVSPYEVTAGDIVSKRDITTGRAHGALRAVLRGLTPEDRVIVNGLMMLRPGASVVVQSPESKVQSEKAAAQTDKPQAKPQP